VGFFAAFGYKTYMKKGNSSTAIPVSSTGLTEIKNLSNAAIQSSSDSQDVITYDTSNLGWKASLVTGNSYTVDCTLNIDVKDPGYILLKEASRDSATGVMVAWYRETPLTAAVGTAGPVSGLTITSGSTGITATGAALTGKATTSSGTGTGLTVDVTLTGGVVTGVSVNAAGTGYLPGDTVTIAKADLAGAATDVTFVVASVTGTGTAEKHAGLASVTNFSESIEAGSIASVSFTLQGYGAYQFTAAT